MTAAAAAAVTSCLHHIYTDRDCYDRIFFTVTQENNIMMYLLLRAQDTKVHLLFLLAELNVNVLCFSQIAFFPSFSSSCYFKQAGLVQYSSARDAHEG